MDVGEETVQCQYNFDSRKSLSSYIRASSDIPATILSVDMAIQLLSEKLTRMKCFEAVVAGQ